MAGKSIKAAQVLVLAAAMGGALTLSSCGWLAGMSQRVNGKSVAAEYHGLAGKSVAIVVYAAPATTDEFPSAREDVSQYLAQEFRKKMPDVRLLNYKEVTRWQDDTINWYGLTEKVIGEHFGVQRVFYVEVLEYSSRMEDGYGDLQGHLRANCKVFEIDTPTTSAVWTGLMDITWPRDKPLEPNQMSEVAVRKRTLDIFADDVTNKLYDHKEFEKSLSEREGR